MGTIAIVESSLSWPAEFERVREQLIGVLGEVADRIDHVGSTSVPRLAAKDIIDVQVTVADESGLAEGCQLLGDAGYAVNSDGHDHPVQTDQTTTAADWQKGFATEPPDQRRVNVHIRIAGRANQKYALLFRDYLKTHPTTAAAYSSFKYKAAALLADDSQTYADLKDPVCDLVYLPALEWAAASDWSPSS